MYKGALFWRMKAGIGEVVFAPLYLALRSRGVKFRFFHRLDDIELEDPRQAVTALRFRRQVKLKVTDREAPTNYKPLISAAGTIPGWPDPYVDQFDLRRNARGVRAPGGRGRAERQFRVDLEQLAARR